MKTSRLFNMIIGGVITLSLIFAAYGVNRWIQKEKLLRQVIERLSADTRIADVLVTKSEYDEATKKIKTTIKFLEYDARGKPLEPKYFTFSAPLVAGTDLRQTALDGSVLRRTSFGIAGGGARPIIQFQSLVIRFQDKFVQAGDRLRGKSACLFMKAFVLDGANTQEFEITKADGIPAGYQVEGAANEFEKKLWQDFWSYALDPAKRERAGVKNAQIEAPGSMFLPGSIYTLKIEHDGGIRIDAQPVPEILKGEKVESAKV